MDHVLFDFRINLTVVFIGFGTKKIMHSTLGWLLFIAKANIYFIVFSLLHVALLGQFEMKAYQLV